MAAPRRTVVIEQFFYIVNLHRLHRAAMSRKSVTMSRSDTPQGHSPGFARWPETWFLSAFRTLRPGSQNAFGRLVVGRAKAAGQITRTQPDGLRRRQHGIHRSGFE